MEASFPNPQRILRPGLFARIKVVSEMRKNAMLVPQRAVVELQGTFSVYVLEADNKVAMRQVTPGPKAEKMWVIEEGLKPSDTVFVEGRQKMQPGMVIAPVQPQTAVADAG